jgi:ABC-type glycerol-3-phosphate transport system permease component
VTEPEGETEWDEEPAAAGDPLGTAALITGCVGIVLLGLVLTVVTAVLAAYAGSTARARGRSLENAFLGFGLAVVDGVVWIFLHLKFDIPFWLG